jgi:hypothetical protein
MAITLLSNNLEERFLGTGVAGNYTYVAYASDSSGSDFSTTYNSSVHSYIAVLTSDDSIANPIATDFLGKWAAINDASVITSIQSSISTHTSSIATNTSNIATNTSAISALESRVSSGETIISTNTSSIDFLNNDKAEVNADNIVPATHAAAWWEKLNYWNSNTVTINVSSGSGNQTINNSTSVVFITNNPSGGGDIDIFLPDATLAQNKYKSIVFIIDTQSTPDGDRIEVKIGAATLFTRTLYNGWKEYIEVKSDGSTWNIVQQNVQGTTEYPGSWIKASTAQVTAGTTDRILTADNISALTATTSRAGIQENADSTDAVDYTITNRTITPNALGIALGNIKVATFPFSEWNMDTVASHTVNTSSLGLNMSNGDHIISAKAILDARDTPYTTYVALDSVTAADGTTDGGARIDGVNSITLYRKTEGYLDDANYSEGILYVWYYKA